jgi:hypothetical protein
MLADDDDFGGNPWFLGGWDPFSSLPETHGEPIPKKSLLFHCKHHFDPLSAS